MESDEQIGRLAARTSVGAAAGASQMVTMRWSSISRHLRRGVAACVVAAAAAQAQTLTPRTYAELEFRYVGPPGNKVVAVAGIPGDPNIVYAGTPSGGVFKSTDGGFHWTPIFDSTGIASIGALAVARSNPNVV